MALKAISIKICDIWMVVAVPSNGMFRLQEVERARYEEYAQSEFRARAYQKAFKKRRFRTMATFATRYKRICIALLAIALFTTFVQEAKCGQDLNGNYSGPRSVVVFAARKISKGARIVEGDLSEAVINSLGFKESDIPTRQSVLSRRSRYGIEVGQIILERELMPNRTEGASSQKQQMHFSTFVEATKHIAAGATITLSDLRQGSVRTADSSKWIKDINQAVGKKAKNAIVGEQILTTDVLMLDSTLPQVK